MGSLPGRRRGPAERLGATLRVLGTGVAVTALGAWAFHSLPVTDSFLVAIGAWIVAGVMGAVIGRFAGASTGASALTAGAAVVLAWFVSGWLDLRDADASSSPGFPEAVSIQWDSLRADGGVLVAVGYLALLATGAAAAFHPDDPDVPYGGDDLQPVGPDRPVAQVVSASPNWTEPADLEIAAVIPTPDGGALHRRLLVPGRHLGAVRTRLLDLELDGRADGPGLTVTDERFGTAAWAVRAAEERLPHPPRPGGDLRGRRLPARAGGAPGAGRRSHGRVEDG